MDKPNLKVPENVTEHLEQLGITFDRSGLTWIIIEVLVVLISYYVARGLGNILIGLFEPRLREIKGRPRLLRFLALILRRLPIIVFCMLIWLSVLVLKVFDWTGHEFTLILVGWLVTAWVVIEIASRAIKNKLVSKALAIIIWVIAALNMLQVLPEALDVLDEISISIGDFRISLLNIVSSVIVLTIGIWMALAFGNYIERKLNRSADLTPSLKVLTSKLLKSLFIVIALLIGFNAVGVDMQAIAVLSGAIGLGVGFGLQKIVSNLISGVILLLDKSIKPGDVITVGDTYGRINSLGARYVSVVARDGREYLIPNEDLITSQVLNWSFTDELVRLELEFRTGYDSDPFVVRELACQAALTHPRVVVEHKPVCHISEFGDSSINYLLRFWIKDPANGVINIKGDIYLLIWQAFKEGGIKVPYPHRQLIFDKTSDLPNIT